MNVREIGWGGMDWIRLTQVRNQWRALENTVIKLRAQYILENSLSICKIGAFSRTQ
jgi:hypothetical protein